MTSPTTTFSAKDTIYAAVSTTGTATNATLAAKWTLSGRPDRQRFQPDDRAERSGGDDVPHQQAGRLAAGQLQGRDLAQWHFRVEQGFHRAVIRAACFRTRARSDPRPFFCDRRARRNPTRVIDRERRFASGFNGVPRKRDNRRASPGPSGRADNTPGEFDDAIQRQAAFRRRTDHDRERQARRAGSSDHPVHRRRRHRAGHLARIGARARRGGREGLRRQAQDPLDGSARRRKGVQPDRQLAARRNRRGVPQVSRLASRAR